LPAIAVRRDYPARRASRTGAPKIVGGNWHDSYSNLNSRKRLKKILSTKHTKQHKTAPGKVIFHACQVWFRVLRGACFFLPIALRWCRIHMILFAVTEKQQAG